MLRLSSDTLFIHPLPIHLAKRTPSSNEKETPHLLYKKPLQFDFDDVSRTKSGTVFLFYVYSQVPYL